MRVDENLVFNGYNAVASMATTPSLAIKQQDQQQQDHRGTKRHFEASTIAENFLSQLSQGGVNLNILLQQAQAQTQQQQQAQLPSASDLSALMVQSSSLPSLAPSAATSNNASFTPNASFGSAPSLFQLGTGGARLPKKKKAGRRSDPRMDRALVVKLNNPEVSLQQALMLGGYTFHHRSGLMESLPQGSTRAKLGSSGASNPSSGASTPTSDPASSAQADKIVDEDGVPLSMRKNNLCCRVRQAKKRLRAESKMNNVNTTASVTPTGSAATTASSDTCSIIADMAPLRVPQANQSFQEQQRAQDLAQLVKDQPNIFQQATCMQQALLAQQRAQAQAQAAQQQQAQAQQAQAQQLAQARQLAQAQDQQKYDASSACSTVEQQLTLQKAMMQKMRQEMYSRAIGLANKGNTGAADTTAVANANTNTTCTTANKAQPFFPTLTPSTMSSSSTASSTSSTTPNLNDITSAASSSAAPNTSGQGRVARAGAVDTKLSRSDSFDDAMMPLRIFPSLPSSSKYHEAK